MNKLLVLLMGPPGSGKTGYCQTHLSDYAYISQDRQGRKGHLQAFDEIVRKGFPQVVVDRPNPLKYERKRYLDLAKQFGYLTRIVWLNADRELCIRRCRERAEHITLDPRGAEKAVDCFLLNMQIPSRYEADCLDIIGPPPEYEAICDVAACIGARRHLIVGDIHGCLDELLDLLDQLAFDRQRDVLISVGDIVDRGPKIKETIAFLFGLPSFFMVRGNHEDKLLRYLLGQKVLLGGGLHTTIAAYDNKFPDDLADRLAALPLILKTPSGYVVHAGFDPEKMPDEQSRYGLPVYALLREVRTTLTAMPAESGTRYGRPRDPESFLATTPSRTALA